MILSKQSSPFISAAMLLVTCAAAVNACSSSDDTTGTGGSAGIGGNHAGAAGASGAGGRSSGGAAGTSGAGSAGRANGGGAGAGVAGNESAGASGEAGAPGLPGVSGPSDDSATTNHFVHPSGGSKTNGQTIFRFETFGNEGFWTRTLELPQGIIANAVTPLMALKAGLSVDIDSIPTGDLKTELAKEITAIKGGADATTQTALNSVDTTVALIEMNAVLGLSARNITTPLDGKITINTTDVYAGESVGVTCALCHSITDGSVFSMPSGGSIGKRVDGPTNHFLNVGAAVALANHSAAFYPTLALDLVANNHQSVSRKGVGVGLIPAPSATFSAADLPALESAVDAYLNDPTLYPVGMFDDAIDGNGAPMHITPFFRTDLAAPWGSDGSIAFLQDFNNTVYTALLDPTDITTPGGKTFLSDRGGAAGLEIEANYEKILAAIGVPAGGENGYPFVGRAARTGITTGLPAGALHEEAFIGIQIDQTMAKDLNTYTDSLAAPAGVKTDTAGIASGRIVFREQCTGCHNDDQSKFVPQNIVPFNSTVDLFSAAPTRPTLWPAYNGGAALATRPLAASEITASITALVPVKNSPGIFDDKLIITEASNRGQPRGDALPLLLDLARKTAFLHDNSVATLDALLNPTRAASDPHPFFIADATDRANVIKFLNSLDDQPLD